MFGWCLVMFGWIILRPCFGWKMLEGLFAVPKCAKDLCAKSCCHGLGWIHKPQRPLFIAFVRQSARKSWFCSLDPPRAFWKACIHWFAPLRWDDKRSLAEVATWIESSPDLYQILASMSLLFCVESRLLFVWNPPHWSLAHDILRWGRSMNVMNIQLNKHTQSPT